MKWLKKLFGVIKNVGPSQNGQIIRITLNDKILPIERGFEYEDPMDEMLQSENLGEITGGGTMQHESGEIHHTEIEIFTKLDAIDQEFIQLIKTKIENLGAPKGSKIIIEKTGQEIAIGTSEGIGIYLDGINLSEEVYANNDVNQLIDQLRISLDDQEETLRYWQGAKETALYFYGSSFTKMKRQISSVVAEHPLCRNARIIQIA